MNRKSVRILVVDDEEIVRESLSGWLEKDGYSLESAPDGPSAVARLEADPWDILLCDLKMPGMDGIAVLAETRRLRPETAVVIMTAYATVDTAVAAIKNGAWDYLTKPFDPEELSLMITKIVREQTLRRENRLLRKALRKEHSFRELVSKSPAMQAVFELARAAAKSASTVLILGESGTGKDLLARAVHAESPRSGEPFVAVSCAALTETLLESELFGYEKGAFTGAQARRQGKFEAAKGGTLFLDEIGDIGPKLQLDLLRVLEERKVVRVGGTEAVPIDVRIVAATNRQLRREVEEGRFRQDLYYRLAVVTINLPPLRERKEDLPLLVEELLGRLSVEMNKPADGVSSEAMARLMSHDWPGNVRELRNVLERGLVVASGPLLQPGDLELVGPARSLVDRAPEALSLEEVERRHIGDVLGLAGGNVTQAAKILEIDRATLYNKIRKYGLRKGEDDDGGDGAKGAPAK
jgi:DNA-binding NtrC family response regulator